MVAALAPAWRLDRPRRSELADDPIAPSTRCAPAPDEFPRDTAIAIPRTPGGCARKVLAGTDAKPKIWRLRGLEILAPLGLELDALLGGQEIRLPEHCSLALVVFGPRNRAFVVPPCLRPSALPIACQDPIAVAHPRFAPGVVVTESRPVVGRFPVFERKFLPPRKAVARMPGDGNSLSRHSYYVAGGRSGG